LFYIVGIEFASLLIRKRDICVEIVERKGGIGMGIINETKVKEEISEMLDCLLERDFNCKDCKNCEKIDACCFLSEAVFVYNFKEKRKTGSAP
jgi:hypothetical protein